MCLFVPEPRPVQLNLAALWADESPLAKVAWRPTVCLNRCNCCCLQHTLFFPTKSKKNNHTWCITYNRLKRVLKLDILKIFEYGNSNLNDGQCEAQHWGMYEVCGCYLVTFPNQTPIFDWCVFRWGSKNKHHEDTSLKEVGLHLKKLSFTPHSVGAELGGSVYSVKKSTNKHA